MSRQTARADTDGHPRTPAPWRSAASAWRSPASTPVVARDREL